MKTVDHTLEDGTVIQGLSTTETTEIGDVIDITDPKDPLWKKMMDAQYPRVLHRIVDINSFQPGLIVEFEGKQYRYTIQVAQDAKGYL